MSRHSLYLQRRGNSLSFRIAIPPDLRTIVGARELVKALSIQDHRIATPIALSLAAQAKQLFLNLRGNMAKLKTPPNAFGYIIEYDISESGAIKVKVDAQPNEQEAATAHLHAIHEIHEATALRQKAQHSISPPVTSEGKTNPQFELLLSVAIQNYIQEWPKTKSEMLKKHKTTLPMFLDIVGDMQIIDLRQSHITKFFKLIQKLPPRWKDKCRQQKINPYQLSLQEHAITISKDTFYDSYKASMRLFLVEAIRIYQDCGFIATLTTHGENYDGTQVGQNKQRALRKEELKRIFEGEELRNFASNPTTVHQFWLPVIGLFTGARVNEICQINPHTDVLCDPHLAIWYFLITDKTKAGSDIVKSVKTHVTRMIPLHPKLIELGFLEYVAAIKKENHGRLFPSWEPRNGRAGVNALKWFTRFLEDIGIHGVENEKGFAPRGMHAFRHTLLTYGKLHRVNDVPHPLNLRCISGHAERSDNPVADGYEDETLLVTLANKLELLSKLDYGLSFPPVVLPTYS